MSILIKGMTMPKSCWDCPMYYHRLSYCNAIHRSLGYADEPDKYKMDWCPLVEVQTYDDLKPNIFKKHKYVDIYAFLDRLIEIGWFDNSPEELDDIEKIADRFGAIIEAEE